MGYKNSKEGSGRWWEKEIADRFDSEIAYGDGIKRRWGVNNSISQTLEGHQSTSQAVKQSNSQTVNNNNSDL